MPLPTLVNLHARLQKSPPRRQTAPSAGRNISDPLTLSEILAIKERLAEYITGVVDAYLGEKTPLSRMGQFPVGRVSKVRRPRAA